MEGSRGEGLDRAGRRVAEGNKVCGVIVEQRGDDDDIICDLHNHENLRREECTKQSIEQGRVPVRHGQRPGALQLDDQQILLQLPESVPQSIPIPCFGRSLSLE